MVERMNRLERCVLTAFSTIYEGEADGETTFKQVVDRSIAIGRLLYKGIVETKFEVPQ